MKLIVISPLGVPRDVMETDSDQKMIGAVECLIKASRLIPEIGEIRCQLNSTANYSIVRNLSECTSVGCPTKIDPATEQKLTNTVERLFEALKSNDKNTDLKSPTSPAKTGESKESERRKAHPELSDCCEYSFEV